MRSKKQAGIQEETARNKIAHLSSETRGRQCRLLVVQQSAFPLPVWQFFARPLVVEVVVGWLPVALQADELAD